jgi:hypothetical protein
VPFILRMGSERYWILVGDAYVHGMMQGEMVSDGVMLLGNKDTVTP